MQLTDAGPRAKRAVERQSRHQRRFPEWRIDNDDLTLIYF